MSRGGRGGFRGGGGGGMRSHTLPFEIDPELDEVLQRGHVDEKQPDVAKKIFPDFGEIILAAPITDEERVMVQIERDMDAQRRAGPFWTGSQDQWDEYEMQSGRFSENFDPFDSAATYGKRNLKRSWRPADLSRIKLEKRFFPPELWDVIDKDDEADAEGAPAKRQKKLGLVKSVLDKLAKFDEGAEDADPGSDDEEDDADENEAEGDDLDRDPGDDLFEDDPDDLDDDYNAEHYFDGGDEDFEEGGGDDYGEDGY